MMITPGEDQEATEIERVAGVAVGSRGHQLLGLEQQTRRPESDGLPQHHEHETDGHAEDRRSGEVDEGDDNRKQRHQAQNAEKPVVATIAHQQSSQFTGQDNAAALVSEAQPACLTRFRHEGDEAPWTGGFSRLGRRRRTLQYVTARPWRLCLTAISACPIGSPWCEPSVTLRCCRRGEHPKARKHVWVGCIVGLSRKLVRYAG